MDLPRPDKEEVVAVGKAAQALAGRDRARDARLEAARDRRLRLDPDQLARDRRIDEASVDVEVAWEERAQAEQAVADAEVAASAAIERLLVERVAVKDVVRLTGLDQPTVRRLRQLETDVVPVAEARRSAGPPGPADGDVADRSTKGGSDERASVA